MPHLDILGQPERLAPSFFGSLAFHGLLVGAVIGVGWVQSRNTINMGAPDGGRFGSYRDVLLGKDFDADLPILDRENPRPRHE